MRTVMRLALRVVGGFYRRHQTPAKKASQTHQKPTVAWALTRNFLYYDGTVMPEIKEDWNEQ